MRLGRVEVTGGFLLLLAWVNYLDRSFLVPMAVLACGAHELGHLTAIRVLGGNVKGIRLTAIGAELMMSQQLGYWQEGLCALAGPGVNLFLALVCCGLECWPAFGGLNLVLALFNLMPAGRLGGGKALYCTLALLFRVDLACRVCGSLNLLCTAGILAAGAGLAGRFGNITLLLVALWLLTALLEQSPWGRRM